ncbi:MAG: glycosyltransferase [Xanthobacteraceae bacterium]
MALEVEIAAAPVRAASAVVAGCVEPADPLPPRQRLSRFPELDCVRSILPPYVVAAVEQRAAALDIGAERVLIAAEILSEEKYVAELARHIGAPFETLDELLRTACPMTDAELLRTPASGMLLVQDGDENIVVVAPRHEAARRFCLAGNVAKLPHRVRLTTNERLQRFVDRHCSEALAQKASAELKNQHPENSAAHRLLRPRSSLAVAAGLFFAIACFAPAVAYLATAIFISCVFFAWTTLRILATSISDGTQAVENPVPDTELPDYTIIVALYREAAVVHRLIAALDEFDYPREKLDIKLVIEADDDTTPAALAAIKLDPAYQIIVAPPGGPRTKPKALNAALSLARGNITAIYDAEDRPDPDQLRLVAARFQNGSDRLNGIRRLSYIPTRRWRYGACSAGTSAILAAGALPADHGDIAGK